MSRSRSGGSIVPVAQPGDWLRGERHRQQAQDREVVTAPFPPADERQQRGEHTRSRVAAVVLSAHGPIAAGIAELTIAAAAMIGWWAAAASRRRGRNGRRCLPDGDHCCG
jgi:hypothetical protein